MLINCLRFLIPYTSQTKVSCPQKNWAMVLPSSIAGVSLMTVSVATGSFLHYVGNVKDWMVSLKVFLEVVIGRNHSSIVTGDLIGCLDNFFRLEAKVWSDLCPIFQGSFVYSFVTCMSCDIQESIEQFNHSVLHLPKLIKSRLLKEGLVRRGVSVWK